jgi:C-terminal processing protease CtpA/Prc
MRRGFIALFAALLVACLVPASAQAQDARAQAEDFDTMWRAIDEAYAYFDASRPAWKRARDAWRAKASGAKTRADFILALEGALSFLRDDHVRLSEQAPKSRRAVPAESDVWAAWREGAAVVTAVRAFSDADVAGLHPGHVVTHVEGVPVERLVRERLRTLRARGPEAMDWALRQLLAGPRHGSLRLTVNGARGPATLEIERSPPSLPNGPPLIARRMGDERDVGYIRIKNVLGHPQLVQHFDAALSYLKDTRALILDLRETPDVGARATTESLLSRFTEKPAAWQIREGPGRSRTTDSVPGMPAAYRGTLIVLVDRWTAGEGEALAAGLEALAHATLVGTPMAGLRGELRDVKLRHSGITVRFPAQRAFHVNGTARESLRPSVEVDLAAPSGGPGDPILYQALKLAEPSSPARGGRTDRR